MKLFAVIALGVLVVSMIAYGIYLTITGDPMDRDNEDD